MATVTATPASQYETINSPPGDAELKDKIKTRCLHMREILKEANGNLSSSTPKNVPFGGKAVPLFVARDLGHCAMVGPYNQVYDDIYLGDQSLARDKGRLFQLKFTHILNTAQGEKFSQVDTNELYYDDLKLKFMGLKLMDTARSKISDHFEATAEFIESALGDGGKIYVHCHQGLSRSATIVLSFLMLKRNMTLEDAIRTVTKSRSIMPNDGFLRQLVVLDMKLQEQRVGQTVSANSTETEADVNPT